MIYEKERRYIIPFDDVPASRAEMPEISVDERRGNFVEVETGFPEDVALREAKRCLSCRRCLGCALCWAECKPEAIDFSIPDEELDLEFDEVILTKGQDNAFENVNGDLGYGRYSDVITDLQFERMLSPTGPTEGMVVSPRNGEIPQRLAFVQAHSHDGDDHLHSSVVLGVNEAILALARTEDLAVTLVSPLSDSFKETFAADAGKIKGLQIIEAIPQSIERKEEEAPLALKYATNGKAEEDNFDLVVVLTKSKLSKEIQSLGKNLDQDVQ